MSRIADYNLGTARGRIEIDAIGAEKGVAKANAAVSTFESKFAKAGRGLVAGGAAIGAGGALIAAGFGFAVFAAAKFEKRMSAIQAVSGGTSSAMELVRQKALQLGKDTVFSADDAAQAIEELAKAGLTLPDILNGAADATVNLAAAGEIDLPQAATIAANAMNGFALAASDMPAVADAIAGAANASAIDVASFGQSLSQVAAVAHLAGLSFHDTAVAIAEMGNSGIKGSDAGTSLKTMLQNLIPTTKQQIDLSRKLGLITKDGSNAFFDQSGKLKSLRDIQTVLHDATKNLTKEQKLQALGILFGSDAIRGAAVLAEQGATGFDKLSTAMGKVTAADVAKKRLDNFNGSLEQLKGSLETMGIVVGTVLLPALRKIVDAVTSLFNKFLALSPATQKTILLIVGIVGAVLLAVGSILALAGGIGILLGALAPLAAAIGVSAGALAGIILIIPLVIAAIVIGFVLLYKKSQAFRDFISAAWAKIQETFFKARDAIMPVLRVIADNLKGALLSALEAGRAAFEKIRKAIEDNRPQLETLGKALLLVAKVIGVVLIAPIIVAAVVFSKILGPAITLIIGVFAFLVTAILTVVGAVVRFVAFFISGILVLYNIAKPILLLIAAVFSAVFGLIVAIVRLAMAIMAPIVSIGMAIIGALFRVAVAIWKAIFAPAFAFLVAVIRGAVGIWQTIIRVAVAVIGGILRSLGGIISAVVGYFVRMVGGITSNINTATAIVKGLPGKIKAAIGNLGSLLYNAGRDVIQGLINGIKAAAGAVGDAVSAVASKIPGPLKKILGIGSPSKVMHSLGEFITEGLANGILSGIKDVQRASTALARVTSPSAVGASATPFSAGSVGIRQASGGNTTEVHVPVTVQAPQNMSPAQVGLETARHIGYAFTTGALVPTVAGG